MSLFIVVLPVMVFILCGFNHCIADKMCIRDSICLVAKKIEKLRVKNTHNKVKSVVGVADNDKQGVLTVAYGIKFHFVGFHKVAQLFNVKRGKPRPAGNEDRACLLYTSRCV